MVLQGQDAWRKLPYITQQYRNPFPHLGLAIGIFSAYLVVSKAIEKLSASPSELKKVPEYRFVPDRLGEVSEVRRLKYKYTWDEEGRLQQTERSTYDVVWSKEE